MTRSLFLTFGMAVLLSATPAAKAQESCPERPACKEGTIWDQTKGECVPQPSV